MAYRQSWKTDFSFLTTILTTTAVALIAGAALAGVLSDTGQLESLAALYRLDGFVSDWVLVLAHSFVASTVFVATITRLARGRYAPTPIAEIPRNAFLGTCAGIVYGVVLWLAIVPYGVPVWFDLVAGVELSTPYRHLESFLAFLCFGAVLGAWYPILRGVFES